MIDADHLPLRKGYWKSMLFLQYISWYIRYHYHIL